MPVSYVGIGNCCGARVLQGVTSFAPDKAAMESFKRQYGTPGQAANVGHVLWIDNDYMGPKYTSEYPAKMVFHENGRLVNGGKVWADAFRQEGYRVDELYLGGNPGHYEEKGHKLTLYVLFNNKEEGKKPSKVREYIYGEDTAESREPGKPPGTGTTEAVIGGIFGGMFAEFRKRTGGT